MNEGDRVLIVGNGHPWRGQLGTIVGRMRLSPATTDEGWKIELDTSFITVAREEALQKVVLPNYP
jgi:hypothetical protein